MGLWRAVAVLRILVGVGFLFAGISKLLDEDLLYGGLMQHLDSYGRAFPLYERFLHRFVEFNQEMFVYAAAIGEILVGTCFLTGALVSLAAMGGALLIVNYGLAISYGNIPVMAVHLLAARVLLWLGRKGAGLAWGVDGWLVEHVNEAVVLFPLRRSLPEE